MACLSGIVSTERRKLVHNSVCICIINSRKLVQLRMVYVCISDTVNYVKI